MEEVVFKEGDAPPVEELDMDMAQQNIRGGQEVSQEERQLIADDHFRIPFPTCFICLTLCLCFLGVKLTGPSDAVYCVVITENCETVISGGGDDKVYVWEVSNTSTPCKVLADHSDSIVAVKLKEETSDSAVSFLVTGSMDSTICVYEVPRVQPAAALDFSRTRLKYKLEGPSSDIEWVDLHPDPSIDVIAAGCADATIWLWNLVTGQCITVLAGHDDAVLCGRFTPNGKRLVSASADASLKLWNPGNLQGSTLMHSFAGYQWHTAPVVSLCFHPSVPGLLASGAQNGRVIVAKLDIKKILCSFWHGLSSPEQNQRATSTGEAADSLKHSVEALAFCGNVSNPTSGLLVSGATDGKLTIFDWKQGDGKVRHELLSNVSKASVIKIKFISDSFLFAICCGDGSCKLLDARAGTLVKHLTQHADMILDFDLKRHRASGAWVVVTASDDNTCRLVDLQL